VGGNFPSLLMFFTDFFDRFLLPSLMFSQNKYFPTYTRTSIIYLGCITFCIIALAATPYLKTDVSVRSSALIRAGL
jgi:hypothetical protein